MIQTSTETIQKRVGLAHVSSIVERLIRLYELQPEVDAVEEQQAATHFENEFGRGRNGKAVIVPAPMVTQATFGWFESV